jgi:C1A family cysteine protease
MENIRIFNYKFQEKDERDYTIKVQNHPGNNNLVSSISKQPVKNIISKKDIKSPPLLYSISYLSPILNQQNLGSCVSNAFSLTISTSTQNIVLPSRLYHYTMCRILDYARLNQDTGTTVRTGCKSISNQGYVNESIYPYNVNNFSTFPLVNILKSAKVFTSFKYTFLLQDLLTIKSCLFTYNVPIIFGFLVYNSFMSVNANGIVRMPNVNTESLIGGHCMTIIGYDDNKRMFTCANSWGINWGNKGLCYIPYDYLLNPKLASDFCLIQFTI